MEQEIGTVQEVDGLVEVVRKDATSETLEVGDPIYQGDLVETGSTGNVSILFADESIFAMAEDSSMTIDELVYDAGEQEGTMNLTMLEGVATYVSGVIAKTDPDAASINTPTATIGIRGTQIGISVRDGVTNVVLMEEHDGFVGEIVVSNGEQYIVINSKNYSVSVDNQGLFSDIFLFDRIDMEHTYTSVLDLVAAIIERIYGDGEDEPEVEQEVQEITAEEATELSTQIFPDGSRLLETEDANHYMPPIEPQEVAIPITVANSGVTNSEEIRREAIIEEALGPVTDDVVVIEEPEPDPTPEPEPSPEPDPTPEPSPEPEPQPEPDLSPEEIAVRDYFDGLGFNVTLDEDVLKFHDSEVDITIDDALTEVLDGLIDKIDVSETSATIRMQADSIGAIQGKGKGGKEDGLQIITEEVEGRQSWEVSHDRKEGYTTMSRGDDTIIIDTDF